MKYQARFARITNFGKAADRFLTCQINQPSSPDSASKGTLYFLIEITNPWISAAQIGQTIINTLTRFYSHNTDNTPLINFEMALKKVNEALAHITQNGETDWIGNLNAVIILSSGDELHIAQTGNICAFLSRAGHINDLTFGSDNHSETHPIKTFSNIASGQIEAGDKIFISNNQLLSLVSKDKIEAITSFNSPKAGLLEIAKILKKQRIKTVNAIMLELLDQDTIANLPLEDLPETIYLDQPLESYLTTAKKYYLNLALPFLNNTGQLLSAFYRKSTSYFNNSLLPKIKNQSKKTAEMYGDLSKKTNKKFNPILSKINTKENKVLIRHYNDAKKNKILSYPVNAMSWLKRHPKYSYGICAIVFIIIFICIISNHSSKNTDQNKSNSVSTQVNALIDKANKAITFNDRPQAIDLLTQAKELASTESDTVKQSAMQNQINTLLNKQIGAAELSFKDTGLIFSGADKIFVYNNRVSGFSLNKNSIIDQSIKNQTQLKSILDSSETASRFLFFDGNQTLFLETGKNQLYSYNLKTAKTTKLSSKSGWAQGSAMAIYNNTVYLLDGVNAKISKYSLSDDSNYSEAFDYITDNTQLSSPMSISVDGSIFVLQKDGQLLQFSKGKKTSFKIGAIPEPYSQITNPLSISTASDSNDIFIVDVGEKNTSPARVLQFDKTGKFIKQLLFPDGMKVIQDTYIQVQAKQIYLLSSDKVYQAQIP